MEVYFHSHAVLQGIDRRRHGKTLIKGMTWLYLPVFSQGSFLSGDMLRRLHFSFSYSNKYFSYVEPLMLSNCSSLIRSCLYSKLKKKKKQGFAIWARHIKLVLSLFQICFTILYLRHHFFYSNGDIMTELRG